MLLEHGAQLYIREEDAKGLWMLWCSSESLLHYALIQRNSNVIPQLAEAIAARRRQLAELARRHLSQDDLQLLGTRVSENSDVVLDAGAESIALALEERGVVVPPQIWPGSQATVYHDGRMTVEAAEQLYACGFRDVDTRDNYGCTPLLVVCTNWGRFDCDLTSWYLDKGASTREFGLSAFPDCLHAVARNLGNDFSPKDFWGEPVLERLASLCSQVDTDDCTCYCSSQGCISVTMLMKETCGRENHISMVSDWLHICNTPSSTQKAAMQKLLDSECLSVLEWLTLAVLLNGTEIALDVISGL